MAGGAKQWSVARRFGVSQPTISRVSRAACSPRKSFRERFWEKVDRRGAAECWPWTGVTTLGYGVIHRDSPSRKNIQAHRASITLAGYFIPPGAFVLHSCGNRCCVNPAHLRIGTAQDNVDDMLERNRECRGEDHPGAKLTRAKVVGILDLLRDGSISQSRIAIGYGVTQSVISRINAGTVWRAVPRLQS